MLKFYGLKQCSTCKRAENWLKDQRIEVDEYIDIRDTPPSKDILNRALDRVNGKPRKMMNTSGQLYRDLNLKKQVDDLSNGEIIDLLSKNGMLVKRPLLVDEDRLTLGANLEELEKVWS